MIKKIIKNFILEIIILFAFCLIFFRICGYRYYVVISDSMAPTLKKYSLVYVKVLTDSNVIETGDIIAIKTENNPILHRVITITDDIIITKGDANLVSDHPITSKDVIGIMKFSIPYIGFFFQSIYPWLIVALGISMYLIVIELIKEIKKD